MRRSVLVSGARRSFGSYVRWTPDHVAVSTFPPIPNEVSNRSFSDYVFSAGAFGAQPSGKKAVIEGESFRTFGDLRRDTGAIRGFVLRELGLGRGDTVTFISPNHVDYFSAVHGFCSAGVCITPANPAYTHAEIESQLRRTGSKAVVTHLSCLKEVERAAKGAGIDRIIVIEDDHIRTPASVLDTHVSLTQVMKAAAGLDDGTNPALPILASGKDYAVMPMSSGTTGLPKGALLSHGNLCANLAQLDATEVVSWTDDEVIISPLPQFHIYAFTVSLNLAMLHGKTLVTFKRFDMDKFCQAVQAYKCTRAHVVPPIIVSLTKSPLVSKYDLSSLKILMSAAAPLGAESEKEFRQRFPGLLIKQAWGMSELSPIGTISLDRDAAIGAGEGSSGPPVASTEMKVVDVQSRKALPPNSEGELLIRGPQVMQGYWKDQEKTRECLDKDGWLSTGDIAKIDDDGFLYITDRLKELIKYKGFQVAPAELEALLLSHPAILDAVVIPRPDKEAEEVPRAYVVVQPDSNVTEQDIIEWAAKQTASYKRLRGGVIFIDKIPKTQSGKILRKDVVKLDRVQYPVA